MLQNKDEVKAFISSGGYVYNSGCCMSELNNVFAGTDLGLLSETKRLLGSDFMLP